MIDPPTLPTTESVIDLAVRIRLWLDGLARDDARTLLTEANAMLEAFAGLSPEEQETPDD